jgi:hypothetical protein
MRRARHILPIVIAFAAVSAHGGQPAAPKIAINVDRQPLVQGEPFTLTIHIETTSRGDPEVRLPRFGGLRILRRSEAHPMSFSFSFGFGSNATSQTKNESNYTFVLIADNAGRYKLDPVELTLDGVKYKGEPYTLDILGSGSSAPADPRAQGQTQVVQPTEPTDQQQDILGSEPPDLGAGELDGAKIDPDFFIQTHLSKKKAVVGEPVVMTIFLYTAANISDLNVIREPGTEGFWVENLLPANRRLTTEPVQVAGRGYDRAVLRKVVLFPIKPGTLTVAPTLAELEVGFGGFFSRRRTVKRSSLPVQIEVVQLPAENQPAGFDPANVGRYTFKAEVDRRGVKAGEPVTLTLTVRGEGNLRSLVLPQLEELDGFKVYAPESDVNVSATGESIIGSKSSRILMISKDPGEYVIPEISWSFYDPQSERYETLKSGPKKITVRPGESQISEGGPIKDQAGAAAAQGQDRLNRQLRSILSRADLQANGGGQTLINPWFLGLFISAPMIFLAIAIVSRTRRKMAENQIKGRTKRAGSVALRRLAALAKRSGELSNEAFFAELARLLTGFIEDRLETTVSGDTVSELKTHLVGRGFPVDSAERVIIEMESSDFARFARSSGKEEERRQALDRMEKLIRDLAKARVSPPPEDKR